MRNISVYHDFSENMVEPLAIAKVKVTTYLPNYNKIYKKYANKEGESFFTFRFLAKNSISCVNRCLLHLGYTNGIPEDV